MTFDQETHERIVFARNPLKVVVAQIRFPPAYALADPTGLAATQAALSTRYPTSLPRTQEMTIVAGPGAPVPPVVQPGPARFGDEAGTWVVSVGPDVASLETTHYVSWVDFRARLRELLEIVAARGQATRIERLGIRYVDEIVSADAAAIPDWQRYIAPNLFGEADAPWIDARVKRSIQQVSMSIDDDGINLTHGYVKNPDGSEYPSTYVMDTDIFTEQHVPFDVNELLERADRYHRWAWNLFRRSITPAAIELLGGTEE